MPYSKPLIIGFKIDLWMDMNSKEKKQYAKDLFLSTELTKEEIALRAKVSRTTLWRWIGDENWDAIKSSRTITRSQLLQQSYSQLKAINEKIEKDFNGVPNKELSDAKGVIRKEIEQFSDNPLHVYIDVFHEFTDWLERNHTDKVNELTELTYEFTESRAKKLSR